MATAKTPGSSRPPRPKTTPADPAAGARRQDSLTRERIIEASIELLDSAGESGLTFRALSDRLATGAGAIYWHIDHKSDLLTAACDTVIARTLGTQAGGATPAARIRALALALFDVIDARPWVGSALTQAAGQLPMVRILEGIGQQVQALGVAQRKAQWASANALLSYILGVAGQNAANAQAHQARMRASKGLGGSGAGDRHAFLVELGTAWSVLDPQEYPFTRSMAGHLPAHDDRADFLSGIDLILAGIAAPRLR